MRNRKPLKKQPENFNERKPVKENRCDDCQKPATVQSETGWWFCAGCAKAKGVKGKR